MKPIYLIFFIGLLFGSCKPKNNVTPEEEPVVIAPVVTPDTGLKCESIPPPPEPFGWKDSTENSATNVIAFIYNPADPNQVICMVTGDITGYNQLISYNQLTKKRITLANLGEFLPSINKKGWIVYSSVDNDIFIIKSNGDSLKQLTNSKTCQDPEWDYTGEHIFYFQQPYLSTNSSLIKIQISNPGNYLTVSANMPYHTSFRKSNQVIYYHSNGNNIKLVQRDIDTQSERSLITATYNPKSGDVPFENLCVDNNDENFYWSNKSGIFKCNLSTLKVDTLLKNCPNYTYDNIMMSHQNNELTLGMHILKPLGPHLLFHKYKAMELDLSSKKLTEIRIFN